MRTARSRTSGENFGDFFMAPFSSVGASAKPGALQSIYGATLRLPPGFATQDLRSILQVLRSLP
jgi:hypothetical protein